jgi:acyl-CoA dehydrogenase
MAQVRLGPGRVHHCMRTIGQCELALQLAAERALERHAFGKPLSEQANVQEWLADSRIEIDQARWLVLHTAWLLDQGQHGEESGGKMGQDTGPGAGQEAANARQVRAQVAAIKVVAARLQQRVVDRAMQIFGAMGLSPDTPLAAFWTWGRALRLMDGPDEVHLRTVARQVLAQARGGLGSHTAYFTTPEQLAALPRLQA